LSDLREVEGLASGLAVYLITSIDFGDCLDNGVWRTEREHPSTAW
jgi:hypothetical protein